MGISRREDLASGLVFGFEIPKRLWLVAIIYPEGRSDMCEVSNRLCNCSCFSVSQVGDSNDSFMNLAVAVSKI